MILIKLSMVKEMKVQDRILKENERLALMFKNTG